MTQLTIIPVSFVVSIQYAGNQTDRQTTEYFEMPIWQKNIFI